MTITPAFTFLLGATFIFGSLTPINAQETANSSAPSPTDPVNAARQQVLANNYAKAREILAAEIQQGPEGEQKDVARLLYASIADYSRLRTEVPKINPGTPSSHGPAVQAELAREKFIGLAQAGKRMDALDAFKQMVAAYPQQVTPFDYIMAILAAHDMKQTQDLAKFLADAQQKFPNDPLLPYVEATPLHWSGDAVQGVALMQKMEEIAPEPLLSLGRAREVLFLSGNFDNADRFDQAKKIAKEVMAAGQIDPAWVMQTITSMLTTVEHRNGGARWLAQMTSEIQLPAVVDELRTATVKEYLRVGENEEARAQVAAWKTAGVDPKLIDSLDRLIDMASRTVSGTVPASMLADGTGWQVTAIAPTIPGSDGNVILDQSKPVGKDGTFSIDVPGTSLIGLVLSGHDSNGKFVVKELGRGITLGHRGNAAYPGDIILPPSAPSAEPPVAPNEFSLKYDFGIGEDFSPQLVELTVPKPADFDPAKLVVKEDGNMAPGSPPTVPAQILKVGDTTVKVGVWRGLKQGENVRLHVLFDGSAPAAAMPGKVTATPENPGTMVVDTGPAQFRVLALGEGDISDPARSFFVLAVKGPDNVWHGTTEWVGTDKPTKITVTQGLTGPIRTSFLCHYEFSNSARRDVTLSFDAGQPYVLIDEDGHGPRPGEWHWTLKAEEGFDQAYHACRPFHSMEPLVNRTPHFGASLRDYCYFNGGNGDSLFIGATRKPENPAGLRDAVTLFEVHPGDWTNPGNKNDLPLDDDPDAQWSHPERYCGSMNTMISTLVTTDKEMPFTIPVEAGVRRWGMAVTDQKGPDPIDDRDPHAVWALQRLLHSFGRGDLNRFLPMKLIWPVGKQGVIRDLIQKRLPQLAADSKIGLYAKAQADLVSGAFGGSNDMTIVGIEKEDPAMLWLGWRTTYDLLRRCGIGCLSIDTTEQGDKTVGCGDYLNMVGNRGFTPAVIGYAIDEDVGLVTEAERQDCRRDAALLAYRYWDADTMNYHANAGQPNFEADRLLQFSTFPAMFPDHPDSDAIAHNVATYTAAMLKHWTIRDGGKWAENVGAYYPHSFNCTTMTVYNLTSLGLADEVTSSPYFEPFCRFAINTLQTPQPEDRSWLKKDAVDSDPGPFNRTLPAMGDHGFEGGSPIMLNFVLMAQNVEKTNPKLASDLTALWEASGELMGAGGFGSFGEYPVRFLLFGRPDYPPEKLDLEPKRLHGWGFVMRDGVGTDKEFYLAFRAGTAAYRDTGNGSEFLMGALGRPLSLDGSDISGADARTNLLVQGAPGLLWPVPRGTVTRWLLSDAVEFARGEFPNGPVTPLAPDHYSRDILFARNDYVLVHDEVHTTTVATRPGIFSFSTPAVSVDTTPQGALCKGKLGVDLWITKLADQQPTMETHEYSYGDERTTVANQWKQIAVRVPIGAAGTILLYPVKSGGAAPQIKKLADGVWQISGPGFNDVYFDQDGTTDGGTAGQINFKGQMGLWRPAEEGRPASFSLLNGDSVSLAGQTLTAQAPATFELQGSSVKRTDGTNESK